MVRTTKKHPGTGKSSIDERLLIVRNFIDEFYNKTMFQQGRNAGLDFSPALIKVLFVFADETTAYPIGELGKRARVKSSTITDMIDRLERDGIVERFRDALDRRIITIRLTEKGKQLRKVFTRKRRKEIGVLFARLHNYERDRLLYHLQSAHRILRKIDI
jgi:DNA-binding MarR family transcriptional regulator